MYHTLNGREYSSLSIDIFISENENESKKKYTEMYFFHLHFSIVHISTNNVIGGLKFCIHVVNIHVEGTVSQIFFIYLSFYFMSKNG